MSVPNTRLVNFCNVHNIPVSYSIYYSKYYSRWVRHQWSNWKRSLGLPRTLQDATSVDHDAFDVWLDAECLNSPDKLKISLTS